jgi:hypothetical protein
MNEIEIEIDECECDDEHFCNSVNCLYTDEEIV